MPHFTKRAVINFSSTGDNIVIAALPTATIHVYGIFFTVTAATNITFKHGSIPDSGPLVFTSLGSSMSMEINSTESYFTCDAGEDFIMNQSGTAQISGMAYYTTG